MSRALRDSTFWGLLLIGLSMLLAAWVFTRMDTAFMDRATVAEAVVIDKSARSGDAGSSSRYSIRYEWTDSERSDRTHQGAGAYSGGEEAFDALVIGESTVRIAWAYTEDGRTLESRLVEEGFTGVPWPMVILGLGMLVAAPIRLFFLQRSEQGEGA